MAKHNHFDKLAKLLELEAAAEAEQLAQQARQQSGAAAERSGNCLVKLVIRDEQPAFGGRVVVTLAKRDQTQSLPWNRLSVGTPVLLTEEVRAGEAGRVPVGRAASHSAARSTSHGSWRGLVSRRDMSSLDVVLSDSPEPENDRPTFRLNLASDEISRQRMKSALAEASRADRGRLAQLRDVLLGHRPPKIGSPPPAKAATIDRGPPATDLNASQRAAIEFALSAADIAIIHGPPGTGKTTTVVELIRQAIARGEKVLACAPSNLAVDNLLERLVHAGERAIRLGHPARVLPELQEHTLDLLVDAHPDVAVARRLIKEANQLFDKAARFTRAKPLPGAKQQMRAEARELIADARRIELQVAEHLLDSATVLCATLTGVDSQVIGDRTFDLVVIDEAAQAIEPACWIPLVRAGRVVLAGDHCQLPPTIVSNQAAREGLAISLMERLLPPLPLGEGRGEGRRQQRLGEGGAAGQGPHPSPLPKGEGTISRLLTTQYRMHEAIMGFSSAEFYDSSLIADDSVKAHLLQDMPGVTPGPLTSTPLAFIDTAGAGYDEELEPDGESRRNPAEAQIVGKQVQALLDAGISPRDIAVIAPYSAQVRLLRDQLVIDGLEIDTVDGFQGREKEAVIISLVRANAKGEIGFLADTRRMNVALTRARRKLILIGDSATIGGHPFYHELLEYFELHDAYGTVWDQR